MSIPPEALQKVSQTLRFFQLRTSKRILIDTMFSTTARPRDRISRNCGPTADKHREDPDFYKTARRAVTATHFQRTEWPAEGDKCL